MEKAYLGCLQSLNWWQMNECITCGNIVGVFKQEIAPMKYLCSGCIASMSYSHVIHGKASVQLKRDYPHVRFCEVGACCKHAYDGSTYCREHIRLLVLREGLDKEFNKLIKWT